MNNHRIHIFFHSLLTFILLFGGQLSPVLLDSLTSQATNSQSKPVLAHAKTGEVNSSPMITQEQAISLAVNEFEPSKDGFILRHPRYEAQFSPRGLDLTLPNSSLTWSWRLSTVYAGNSPLPGAVSYAVPPSHDSALEISYPRSGFVEKYLAREDRLEQQFLIQRPLALAGADLVIEGEIESQGIFEAVDDGWLWRLGDQAVRLGKARAFDASGSELPVSMQATAKGTSITVEGASLISAEYPVTIDPEFGPNDVRLSWMLRDPYFDAYNPEVAYNSTDHEFLVVWYADDDDNFLADNEFEIYAQRISATSGMEIGSMISVSNMGTNGFADYDALNPAVAYNSTNNQYLVVWEADIIGGGLVNDEFEIYGQLLAADGTEIDPDDQRLSDMEGLGDPNYDAIRPDVVYDSHLNRYLVVWQGDDGGSLANDENEIYGQLLTHSLSEVGTNDFRISDMGPDGNASYDAYAPAVTYNSQDHQYLVVWTGSDNIGGMAVGEAEIFGQRLDDAGTEVGSNDFRISDMGGSGNTTYNAYFPDVAYNSTDNQYLAVWYGDDNTGALVNEEYEIFGQRMNASGGGEGPNDFRISDMGSDGSIAYRAEHPSVAYDSEDNQYLVVWHGVDNTPPLVAGEQEIFGQLLNASGSDVGDNDFRISHMGPDGNYPYKAERPAVASGDTFFVTWYGDDDHLRQIDDEFEIFGTRLSNTGWVLDSSCRRISYMEPMGNPAYDASTPAVALDPNNLRALVVWSGDTNVPPLVDNEYEIFGYLDGHQFRISVTGVDGSPTRGAFEPAVAFNSQDNQYLVVWQGDDEFTDDEFEIYGQLLTAEGALIGVNFRISDMGPDNNNAYDAYHPDVAYNNSLNQYLVVWWGDDNTGSLLNNEYEIFGQLLDANGNQIGTNDFRISDMGGIGNTTYGAMDPAVVYNPDLNQYLVVWQGTDNLRGLVQYENEIFGQFLHADGSGVAGTHNDFRISDMGGTGNSAYNAFSPDVVYNTNQHRYLVVWYGDDNTPPLVDDEYEIYGQQLTPTGGGVGPNDFRISDMGPDGDDEYDAYYPAIEYNAFAGKYMVVWNGDNGSPLANDENEIYGQLLNNAGSSVGENDFRLSDMGPDGNYSYNAAKPAILFASRSPHFLVVWEGDDDTSPLVNEEFEIFYQFYNSIPWIYLPVILN